VKNTRFQTTTLFVRQEINLLSLHPKNNIYF
jgi:hypothetical protein